MNGCIWFRADHDLVGRVLAEKLRIRHEQRGDGDTIRIARPRRKRVVSPPTARGGVRS